MGAAIIPITLRAQHSGINPCMNEGSANGICSPLRQLHVAGWTANAMSIAAYFNQSSSRQLFDQTGGLPHERVAARQNLGTIGSEINGWEIKSRLIRSAN